VTDFDEARFKDPRALALMRKLMLRSDPLLSSANLGANLEVVLRNGSVLNASVPIPPGSMLNPAGDSELTTKFVALSEAVLGRERTERAIEIVLAVDMAPDLRALVNALCPLS
jgi:2-methylcitrate dehydratase PrpD